VIIAIVSNVIIVAGLCWHCFLQSESIERLKSAVDGLPKTADGVPFFIGDKVFSPNPDRQYFGPDEILEVTIAYISKGTSFVEYRGEFTVSGSGSDIEGGNLDFYSTREACPNYGP